jgi:hypothetical protein
MRTTKGVVITLLLLCLRAMSQQDGHASPAAASQTSQTGQPAAAEAELPTTQPTRAQPNSHAQGPTTMDQVVDRIIEREHNLLNLLQDRTPVVETYLQNMTQDPQLGPVPKNDRYFLGRMDLSKSIDRKDYMKQQTMEKRLLGGFTKFFKVEYRPLGFSWMIVADRNDFDREHYDFRYAHREFLGEVRCLVFDVTPRKSAGKGRFLGRIWVEDQHFNIVRLNGTFAPRPRSGYFFHMDSLAFEPCPGILGTGLHLQ